MSEIIDLNSRRPKPESEASAEICATVAIHKDGSVRVWLLEDEFNTPECWWWLYAMMAGATAQFNGIEGRGELVESGNSSEPFVE